MIFKLIPIFKKKKELETNIEVKPSENKIKKIFIKGYKWDSNKFPSKCPFCDNDEYLEGPSGGMSVNFMCSKCTAKFNAMGPFGVELLEGPSILYSGNYEQE